MRVRPWPSSLRARLTLWYSLLLALPLVGFAFAGYFTFGVTLQARTDHFIGDALSALSREVAAERRATAGTPAAIRATIDEVRFRDLHIVVLDATGAVIAMTALADNDRQPTTTPSPEVGREVLAALRGRDLSAPLAFTFPNERDHYRVLARPLTVGAESYRIAGAYSLRDSDDMLARIRRTFLIAIPLLVASAAAGASVLAKRSLAPVASMAAHAAEISATNLTQRLPVGGGDELVGLARVINDLLDRLEHSFEQQRRFVADASHELRTPTAILRTEADVTLARDHRTEDEYRASLTVMRNATRRLTRIVDDLFLLARADAGHLVMQHAPLYLDELVLDTTRAVRAVAQRRGVQLELTATADAPFTGDADLLGRLLLNLLDNAIKYSPAGGTVSVALAHTGDHYDVTVRDAGIGIPEEAQARVFERFYRVDAARSRDESAEAADLTPSTDGSDRLAAIAASTASGAGLGLAIARRIAEMHGGRLTLSESAPGCTIFQLSLPTRTG